MKHLFDPESHYELVEKRGGMSVWKGDTTDNHTEIGYTFEHKGEKYGGWIEYHEPMKDLPQMISVMKTNVDDTIKHLNKAPI